MTTLKKLASHTGLEAERVGAILTSSGYDVDKLTIDEGRIAIIKALRASASGNTQKEEVEIQTSKLLQAKRIKLTEQIKIMRGEMKPASTALNGYIIDDTNKAEYRSAKTIYDLSFQLLLETLKR